MLSMNNDDSVWTYNGFLRTGDIPTPPCSPPSLDMDGGEMVNPNSVLNLNDTFRESDPSLNILETALPYENENLRIPLLEDIALDIKMENFESLLGDDYNLNDSLCSHGFVGSLCSLCFGNTFKTEIVNDCMWTAGTSSFFPLDTSRQRLDSASSRLGMEPASSRLGMEPASSRLGMEPASSRQGMDLASSRQGFSDGFDHLDITPHVIGNLSDGGETANSLETETPSDTSDTDTDTDVDEGGHTPAENVQLDHNYHYSHSSETLTRPLMRALHKVSLSQADSDDEIDVVNVGVQDTVNLTRVSKYSSTVATAKDASYQLNSSVTPKRGRKAGSQTTKKVGRPSKASKRLENTKNIKGTHSEKMRRGGRSVSMDPMKRSLHNNMERMRRVDLKNCFDTVRASVPALQERTRAPKVLILKSALDLVVYLQMYDKEKLKEIHKLKKYQRYLQRYLHDLKKELGMVNGVHIKEEGLG